VRRLLLAASLLSLSGAPLLAATKAKTPAAGHKPAAAKPAPAGEKRPGIQVTPDIRAAVDDSARDPNNRLRDKYRHPAQTLSFFGVTPTMTVVEILPSGGWYTEILAPLLASSGHYIGAVPAGKSTDSFTAFLAKDPARFGKAAIVAFNPGQPSQLAPDGSADMVLTFRNVHNLLGSPDQAGDGNAPQAFADWFRALKPGGVLGIEEHRLPENMDAAREKTTGYVKRSTVIRLAMAAGFQLVAASDVNANPKDDHDHPKGVWTLPPSYELGDQDKAKYAAIGESDRMTLKFVKPDPNAPVAAPVETGGTAPQLDTDKAVVEQHDPTPSSPADPANPKLR
jgi:predicted methyltransferase